MIVFETQEEFERAVMQIIETRLGVNINLKNEVDWDGNYTGKVLVERVKLYDKEQ